MAEPDEENKINLLDNVSSILSDISGKVSELNKCSSDDFVRLNESLKKQYKRIEDISENIHSVFEFTSGTQNQELFNDIQKYFEDFLFGMSCSEEKNTNFLDFSDKIISHVNLMYIPLKNFSQNVVTLNFLANSLKFNLLYRLKNKKGVYDEDIKIFTEKIETLKDLNVDFDEIAVQIKESYSVVSENIRVLQESNLIIKEKTEEKIVTILKRLEEKYKEGQTLDPNIKNSQTKYTDSVSKILTNLQYSDIIRQKIEHISDAHNDMILRLKDLKKDEEVDARNRYMLQIKDIADLQVAQLVRTNSEYQNAVQVISEKFAEIGVHVFTLTNETLKFSGRRNIDIEKHYDFYLIEELLQELEGIIENSASENNHVKTTLNKLNTQIADYSKVFDRFEVFVKEILEVEQNLLKNTKEIYEDPSDVNDILIQIKTVSYSIRTNYEDIKRYFSSITVNNTKIIETGKSEHECLSFDTYKNRVNDIYNLTKSNNTKIRDIVSKTEQTEKIVLQEINNSVKGIQYYSLYETISNTIIGHLKELFNLISVSHGDTFSKTDLLEHHKIKYTMESERSVHEQVATGTNSEEKEDDEVEFF